MAHLNVYEMQEDTYNSCSKPPVYDDVAHPRRQANATGGILAGRNGNFGASKTPKSQKCILVVTWIAIAVNFLLIICVGAVLYVKFSEIDGQISPSAGDVAAGSRNNASGGSPGPPGPQGPQGQKGQKGAEGVGQVGPRGDMGVQGPVGPAGATGLQGQKGEMGSQGIQGLRGVQGPLGPAGAVGAKGQKGESGSQGVQGSQGLVGPAGAAGPKGQKGQKGSQGATGTQGIQGPAGPPGATQGGVTYTRWGSSTCPSVSGTQMVYSGFAAGSRYDHSGGGANYICTPTNPQYGLFRSGFQGEGRLHGTEYKNNPIGGNENHNAPCAVCLATTRGAMHMFPARSFCPTSWTLEYSGWLMSAHRSHHRSMYECVDRSLESLPGSSQSEGGAYFYHVEADCARGLPCPPYILERELRCVVCTK